MQEKIKQLELKLSEYRNQCQSLRQEIKLAQKVKKYYETDARCD